MYVFMLLLEMVYWKLVLFVMFDEFFIFGNFLFVFFVKYKGNINMDCLKVLLYVEIFFESKFNVYSLY